MSTVQGRADLRRGSPGEGVDQGCRGGSAEWRMNLNQANRLAQMAFDMVEQPDLAHTLDRILLNARSSLP